jgi:thiol-disulfide isomerase/thioredoxin
MPSLDGATEWFGATRAHAEAEAKERPTLVHFWSISCSLCKENLARLSEWRKTYWDEGLRLIAVHMPRYEADTNVEAVREAIAIYKITEPCAIDNDHKLRESFQNEQGYVPAYYLFNREGKLKSFAAGERGLNMIAPALERLFATAGEKTPAQAS